MKGTITGCDLSLPQAALKTLEDQLSAWTSVGTGTSPVRPTSPLGLPMPWVPHSRSLPMLHFQLKGTKEIIWLKNHSKDTLFLTQSQM